MNLDPKILPGKRPLTCFDTKEAKLFIGKKCYICNNYDCFRDLELIQQTILKGVEDCEVPFHYNSDEQAEFCLPVEWVKPEEPETTFRPFSPQEFMERFAVGSTICYRHIGEDREINLVEITRIETNEDFEFVYVFLGTGFRWDLKFMFDNIEIKFGGKWQPFGIEEQV